MITIIKTDPYSADSQRMIKRLSSTLAMITGDSGTRNFDPEDIRSSRAIWALAMNDSGEAVGCGCIRPLSASIAELKRMFSTGTLPGIGAALLRFLENQAVELGYRQLWLETRLINQRAVAFYMKQGYEVIANYGPYIGREEAICLSKVLDLQL